MKEGIEIKIGDDLLIVPSLSLKQVRLSLPKIKTLKMGSFAPADMAVCVEIVHAALTRNYPEMTKDQVEDGIDMRNMAKVLNAVMAVSGMEVAQPGEIQAAK